MEDRPTNERHSVVGQHFRFVSTNSRRPIAWGRCLLPVPLEVQRPEDANHAGLSRTSQKEGPPEAVVVHIQDRWQRHPTGNRSPSLGQGRPPSQLAPGRRAPDHEPKTGRQEIGVLPIPVRWFGFPNHQREASRRRTSKRDSRREVSCHGRLHVRRCRSAKQRGSHSAVGYQCGRGGGDLPHLHVGPQRRPGPRHSASGSASCVEPRLQTGLLQRGPRGPEAGVYRRLGGGTVNDLLDCGDSSPLFGRSGELWRWFLCEISTQLLSAKTSRKRR